MNLTYAYLETTSYCNVDCQFCNRKEVITGLKHMDLAEFDRILAQLQRHPITEAKLMGMGEPFMHPKFYAICKRFKETFPKSFLISATNCQLKFNDNYIKALEHLDMLYLSIDGSKENYEGIRTGSSWDKLTKFLNDLSDYKDHHLINCKLPINFTVVPQNVYDIPDMLDLMKAFRLDDLRLNFVQNWTEGESDIGLLNGFTPAQHEFLSQYKQYFKGKSPWTYSDCFWPKSGVYITVDGNVKMCPINTSAVPFGNVFSQPLELTMSSKRYVEIKSACANNAPADHCKNCSYKELEPYLNKILNENTAITSLR